ncbi:MAG: hypothetical protein NTV24_00690 [Candidatus Woesebacteria bacterium]|nr:hypothetical protein [Candidatus Woesebacteria bacterium]
MKDKEPKIHPLVKLGRALGIVALAVGQVRCNPPSATPEATSTDFPSTLTVEPPEPSVGFEPLTRTPDAVYTPAVETPIPAESGLGTFRAPTLEQLAVPVGEGGPLPEYAQSYYNVMDQIKINVAQKVGVDPNKVETRYWDNKGSQDAFGWMLYYKIDGGGVIWPLKPDGALADYPAYFEGQVQPDGSLVNLRINSDYNNWVVVGENAAAIFGGTLPVIVDSPVGGIYSRWFRPGGQPEGYAQEFLQWQMTPGVSIPLPEGLSNLPDGFVPVRNEDNTWGIGREVNGETVEIPGIAFSENKFMLNLGDGETLDITDDINAIKIVDHPSGAEIIDMGERTGFVWKGDKWAEILLQIKFETDGTKFNEFPVVNYEDVTSGALAESERLATQPFPEGVEPVNNYYYDSNYGTIYPNYDPQIGYEFSIHLEKFPMRYVYFYQTKIGDVPVVMATLQVLNKDNSSVFIHIVESRDFLESQKNWWTNNIQLRRRPVFGLALGGTEYNYCEDGWSEAAKQVCGLNAPHKAYLQELSQKWITEQKIPEELEGVLFTLQSGRWY